MQNVRQERTLRLKGELTIPYAQDIHAMVLATLRECETVVLDVADMTDVDVSFLQILIAAKRSASSLNKTVYVERIGSTMLQNALSSCGFKPDEIVDLLSLRLGMEAGAAS